jgi:hypothetical protein
VCLRDLVRVQRFPGLGSQSAGYSALPVNGAGYSLGGGGDTEPM